MNPEEYSLDTVKKRMDGAHNALGSHFSGLRTGRAHPSFLESVTVEVFGSHAPLKSVASVSVPEPRMLTVQVWEKSNVTAVCKGIINAGLGLNPQPDGTLVRVPVPVLSEERRKEMVKVASKYAEDAKISVRNVRRDAMEALKKLEKSGKKSEDECRRETDLVQKETDAFIKKVDETLKNKEKEIMTV